MCTFVLRILCTCVCASWACKHCVRRWESAPKWSFYSSIYRSASRHGMFIVLADWDVGWKRKSNKVLRHVEWAECLGCHGVKCLYTSALTYTNKYLCFCCCCCYCSANGWQRDFSSSPSLALVHSLPKEFIEFVVAYLVFSVSAAQINFPSVSLSQWRLCRRAICILSSVLQWSGFSKVNGEREHTEKKIKYIDH